MGEETSNLRHRQNGSGISIRASREGGDYIFEYEVPSLEEFRRRVANTLKKHPYLCAVQDGRILGYACAGPFGERAAFGWAAETTIYLARDARGRGLGRRLYEALEKALKAMGILNLYAPVACPAGAEDEYLTWSSAKFHTCLGCQMAGKYRFCGCKFERWYNMACMEKFAGTHRENLAPVRPYAEINRDEQNTLQSKVEVGKGQEYPDAGRKRGIEK